MQLTSLPRNIVLVSAAALWIAAGAAAGERFEAISRPSKDVTLSFTRPGRIAEMHVCVGDRAAAGQLLAQLDDSVEQAQLAQLEAQAADTTRIEAARARLAQSKVDLDKIESAWNTDPERRAVTEFELDHARLEVEIARLTLELSQFEHSQDQRRYEEARLSIGRMALDSPVDGTIEVLFVEAGESVDALQQVIHVVDIDPLWIDIPVSTDVARRLAVGDAAEVLFCEEQTTGHGGQVIHVASVGDAASNTLRVRVELPNPDGRPAGERVFVSFPGRPHPGESAEPPDQSTEPAPADVQPDTDISPTTAEPTDIP